MLPCGQIEKRKEFMKILYFDCFSGVSGDMTLAALLDLGLPLEKLQEELKKLGLENYSLEVRPGSRSGIAALSVEVKAGPHEEHHRHFSHIREMILKSALDPEVKEISLAIFQRLAEARPGCTEDRGGGPFSRSGGRGFHRGHRGNGHRDPLLQAR
jgi:hypothetical protein